MQERWERHACCGSRGKPKAFALRSKPIEHLKVRRVGSVLAKVGENQKPTRSTKAWTLSASEKGWEAQHPFISHGCV